ncbi:serine hydrolase [Oerskovia turbata]
MVLFAPPRRRRSPLVPTLLVAGLTLGGCAASDEPDRAAAHGDRAAPAPAATATPLPTGDVGDAATWVLDTLNADQAPTGERLDRFSHAFLDQVPPARLLPVLDALHADQDWTPVAVDAVDPAAQHATLTISNPDGRHVTLQIGVDDDARITSLHVAPGDDPHRDPATTWRQVGDRLEGLDAHSSVLVARVLDDGSCQAVPGSPRGTVPDAVLPLGSVVKLYVLAAVSTAVEAGALSWDDELVVTDDVRSLPSGVLQDSPAGTAVSVRRAAELMISISDNTATDLLVEAVGRDAVERAMGDLGHHDPRLNTPFLTTRDLFTLGWGAPAGAVDQAGADGLTGTADRAGAPDQAPPDQAGAVDQAAVDWAATDAPGRRAILDAFPGGRLAVDPSAVTTPAWQDGVDWFATSSDLCRAQVWLHDRGGQDPVVRAVLAVNAGLPVDPATWPYVAYKGGSAPGVLTGTWLVEDRQGARHVLTIQLASDDAATLAIQTVLTRTAEDALAMLTNAK